MKRNTVGGLMVFVLAICVAGFVTNPIEGAWEYTIKLDEELSGTLKLSRKEAAYTGVLYSFEYGVTPLQQLTVDANTLNGRFTLRKTTYQLTGTFTGDTFAGTVSSATKTFQMTARRPVEPAVAYNPPTVAYILSDNELNKSESNLDHAGLIEEFNRTDLHSASGSTMQFVSIATVIQIRKGQSRCRISFGRSGSRRVMTPIRYTRPSPKGTGLCPPDDPQPAGEVRCDCLYPGELYPAKQSQPVPPRNPRLPGQIAKRNIEGPCRATLPSLVGHGLWEFLHQYLRTGRFGNGPQTVSFATARTLHG
ncbi:hypothetical protein [Spirosoma telluris]